MSDRRRAIEWSGRLALVGAVALFAGIAAAGEVQILETPGGVRYGLLGGKADAPAPTLFVFATAIEGTLTSDDYNKVGRLLGEQGFVCVALDIPCHGADAKADEPAGLEGWAARLKGGQTLVPDFAGRVSAVLDHLISQGIADPGRIAACGTSRGGFIALHIAAADPRMQCVAAFAPVTDLPAMREFAGMEAHDATLALGLSRQAEALAGRSLWLCIGNNDERVGTDGAIAFTRAVVVAAVERGTKMPDVELHVMPTEGHRIHPTAHDEAAAWIAARLAPAGD